MKLLLYWHDIYLPHSRYILKALDTAPGIREVIILGPAEVEADSIFNQEQKEDFKLHKTRCIRVKTYAFRKKWCRVSEFYKYIKSIKPDRVIVLDEALSVNVLLAGIANRVSKSNARVIFYGFENIYAGIPYRFLWDKPDFKRLLAFLGKTLRFLMLDQLLMPLRKSLIYGGLTSYTECTEVIHRYNWFPVIEEQWWPINRDLFDHSKQYSKTSDYASHIADFNGKRIIGFAGRFIEEKGIDELVNAFLSLGDQYQLLLIGGGTSERHFREKLESYIKGGQIMMIPPLNQRELSEIMNSLDLLVLPSRTTHFWKEQYGRALVEAMASRTMVLGSDSGAIPFVIGHPELIFKERNIHDLAGKINMVFSLPVDKKEEILSVNYQRSLQADPNVFVKRLLSI